MHRVGLFDALYKSTYFTFLLPNTTSICVYVAGVEDRLHVVDQLCCLSDHASRSHACWWDL